MRLFRRDGVSAIERALLEARSEPRDELVDALTDRIGRRRRRSGRRPRRIAAVALAAVMTVAFASFGGLGYAMNASSEAVSNTAGSVAKLVRPPGDGGGAAAKDDSGIYLATIGTYANGQYICHWQGTTYDSTGVGTSTNWDPVFLTSPALYADHTGHTFDIGPNAGYSSGTACATAASGANALSASAVASLAVTNTSPVVFTVSFTQSVTDFTNADIVVGGTAGATTATIVSGTGSGPYTINVTGMTGDGTVTINVPAGTVHRATGVANFASNTATSNYDTTAPTLTTLEMFDTNADGKVDQAKATFNEALANYTAGNGPWTLANVPSGGSLGSVAVAGSIATLTITAGGGSADTAVGAFTIALAQNASGIRDLAGNQSSFGATAPGDKAKPVLLTITSGGGTAGLMQSGDTIAFTFSEAINAGTVPATATVTEQRSGGSTVNVAGIIAAAVGIDNSYLGANNSSGTSTGAVALSGGNKTITVTLGAVSTTGSGVATGTGSATMSPSTALTDAAGNTATGPKAVARLF